MDAEKIKIDETPVEKDDIPFFPDGILLHIFSNISDLKTLFHCSLVSKRFASVIYQVRDVSVTLIKNTARSPDYIDPVSILCSPATPFYSDELFEFPEQSLHKLDPPVFLEKFSELESIYLEYTFPITDDDSSLLKWKVNFGSRNSIVESFVAILPDSVHKETDYVPDQDLNNSARWPPLRDHCFSNSYACYMEWLYLVCTLLRCHAMLRHVTVTDSLKQGKLVIKDEQLLKIRSCFLNEERGITKHRVFLNYYNAPELHLPVSGYVMKRCAVAIKVTGEANAMATGVDNQAWDYDEGEKVFEEAWDFDEEKKVFDEAVKEVLKNPWFSRFKGRFG